MEIGKTSSMINYFTSYITNIEIVSDNQTVINTSYYYSDLYCLIPYYTYREKISSFSIGVNIPFLYYFSEG